METIWSFNNTSRFFNHQENYIPLTPKQIEKLVELWNEEKNSYLERELNLIGDYKSGFISKEELLSNILDMQETAFTKVQERFAEEYWIDPIKTELKEGGA